MAKQALGMGLDALIGTPQASEQKTIPLSNIVPNPYQPRAVMEEVPLEELVQSIREHGVMQPILVRAIDSGYEIIAGERRYQAAKRAGLSEIPAIVKVVDDKTSAIFALIENMQREDLNPLEQARGIQRLIDEFNYTHDQVASVLGKSRAAISNTLRLTNLTPKVQELLMAGELEMGHARCLIPLSPEEQVQTAQKIRQQGLSVRQVEALVKESGLSKAKKPAKSGSPTEQGSDWRALEESLADQLATSVKIQSNKSGFTFVAEFANEQALQAFITKVMAPQPL